MSDGVDLSTLAAGDVVEFKGGLRATVQWARTRGGLCAAELTIPMPGGGETVHILYKVYGEPGMAGFDARHLPGIVRVLKGGQGDGSA